MQHRKPRDKGLRPVGVTTAAGAATLERRYFWSPDARAAGCPADTLSGLAAWPDGALSPGAREVCCLLALACPFRTASEDLRRIGGLRVCPERLRQCVEREAASASAAKASGALKPSFTAADLPAGASRLYVGLDGLFVATVTDAEKRKRRRAQSARRAARTRRGIDNAKPLPPRRAGTDQRFKEVKVGLFYDQAKEHRHAWATGGDAAAMGGLLREQAALLKLDQVKQTRSLTDGAAWIVGQLAGQLPMLGGMILDVQHLSQHVHATAAACLGDGSEAARAWSATQVAAAKERGPDALLAAAGALGQSVRSAAKRRAVGELRAYVENHRPMLDYPAAIAGGWDIGSGPTEAVCKTLSLRLRGPGMKWDLDHAAALMDLKALHVSGQAPAYWAAAA